MFIYLLILIPVSLALSYLFHAAPIWIFISAGLAIVPLAVWIQRGTEQIAFKSGPSIGGLLNVTFGNAAELIIALFVLSHGSAEVVKGQITGSIIGNSLLGLGLAIVIGTWNRSNLHFNRNQAGQLSTMLVLVLIGLLLPAIYDFNERFLLKSPNAANLDETLSLAVSVVLIMLYFANLVYTLYTHRDVFAVEDEHEQARWPLWQALLVLILATIFTAWESELVSGALEETAKSLNISIFFLGVIVLALVGNVAEYVSAIYFARQDKMSMSMSITVGATIQVALFVAPVLVLVSNLMGHPMNLVFSNPLELIAIAAVAFAVSAISKDGEVDWFEGALLIGLYILIAISFFLVLPA
jgi:Ca2+:H+ antiporter